MIQRKIIANFKKKLADEKKRAEEEAIRLKKEEEERRAKEEKQREFRAEILKYNGVLKEQLLKVEEGHWQQWLETTENVKLDPAEIRKAMVHSKDLLERA